MARNSYFLARVIAIANVVFFFRPYYAPVDAALRRWHFDRAITLWLLFSSAGLVVHLVSGIFRGSRQWAQDSSARRAFAIDLLFSLVWFGSVIFFILKNLPVIALFG